MISEKLKEIEGINEELLSAILETTTDAVIVITYDHKICLFNDATVKLFGYEPDELLDNDLDILLPEEMRGDTHREKVKWFADKKHHPVAPTQRIGLNLQGRRKNKSIFYASIAISRVEYKGIPHTKVQILNSRVPLVGINSIRIAGLYPDSAVVE